MAENPSRIKFYGVNDLSTGLYLAEAETKLVEQDFSQPIRDINDAIELYNILEIFKTNLRMPKWTDEDYAVLTKRSSSIMGVVGRYFSCLSNDNIIVELGNVNIDYNDDFWVLFSLFSLYERICSETISRILTLDGYHIHSILKQNKIVQAYSETLTKFLMESEQNAELLITEFLSEHEVSRKSPLYMPKDFTSEKREQLINDYISSEKANPNLLKLICESRNNDLPLSLKTKLAAQKRYDTLIRELFPSESDYGIQFSFELRFDPESDEPIKAFSYQDGNVTAIYGQKWIENNLDFPTLWNNFIYMFNFVDRFSRCQFVSTPNKHSVLERFVVIRGSSTYFLSSSEQFTNSMYSTMLLAYQHTLELLNIQIESLFSWFFNQYIPDEFHIAGFIFNPPSNGSSNLEKCKIISTEIDSVLKQFDLFSREGTIDRELFEINSDSLKFRNIPALIPNKYLYSASDECTACMNCLFSDQNTLPYTERHEAKYRTFYELIRNEKVSKAEIPQYNLQYIDFLLDKKCISLTSESEIEICARKVALLRDLYNNQYCCTTYLKEFSNELQELFASNDIRYGFTLFSAPEQDYISYVLTKSDFSNGLDLRNKYIHGNYPNDPSQHKKDYLELLKVFVLIVIKINEELCLREDLTKLSAEAD